MKQDSPRRSPRAYWVVRIGKLAGSLCVLFPMWFGLSAVQAETGSDRLASFSQQLPERGENIEPHPSKLIDQFIESGLKAVGQQPNVVVDDVTFLRRAYLDIIGRIPTLWEAREFLESQHTDKREVLIDALLESPGYVLHQFNFWADLLRARSDMQAQGLPSEFYTAWIKECLQENKPYDEWVREMLSAQGYVWSTPATGYLQRDQGMPLDNMSNTVQVFLGTRLQCAQCHDHPTDVWTRHDFYQMAAYRHHLSTVRYSEGQWPEMKRILDERKASKEVRTWASRTFAMLKRRVYDTERELLLPDDYVGDDAQPGDVVDPAVIFGSNAASHSLGDRQQAFAQWLTSSDNPRFTKVIANRMWKKVMGEGLIEPVDNLSDESSATHPQLLAYLESLMVDLEYDLKEFQRILYRTRLYQRAVCNHDLVAGETYSFPGPLLKQMSAEQLWDSLITLMAPDIDRRQGARFARVPYLKANLTAYELATPEEIVEASYQAEEVRRLHNETDKKEFEANKKLASAKRVEDAQLVDALRDEIAQLQHFRKHEIPKRLEGANWLYRTQAEYRKATGLQQERRTQQRTYWDDKARSWCVRAAELASPEDPQHPLRIFGQSDREQIDNASLGPTAPLVLTMLNGELFSEICHEESVVMQNADEAETPMERAESLCLTLLSRPPRGEEIDAIVSELQQAEEPHVAVHNIIWALINTREFMFIR